MTLHVPASWRAERARVVVDVPARVTCDRCDGGGCSACDNRGGYSLGRGHTLALSLGGQGEGGARLRLVPEFAEAAGLDALLVDLRDGEASDAVRRLDLAPARRAGAVNWPVLVALGLGVLVVLAALVAAR